MELEKAGMMYGVDVEKAGNQQRPPLGLISEENQHFSYDLFRASLIKDRYNAEQQAIIVA